MILPLILLPPILAASPKPHTVPRAHVPPATTPVPPVTTSLPTGPMQNEHSIYAGLRAMGLSHIAAAGVMGNLYQESHGNSYAVNPVGGGLFGLTLANGGTVNGGSVRFELRKLGTYISQNGSVSDINAHAGNPAGAAYYFGSHYERPGAPMYPNRERAAMHFAEADN